MPNRLLVLLFVSALAAACGSSSPSTPSSTPSTPSSASAFTGMRAMTICVGNTGWTVHSALNKQKIVAHDYRAGLGAGSDTCGT
ncbi:MAG TPA: hypothetical protein VFA27_17265 [Vicinamibacterales bacterium]|nr:hypothetical protein [Vicinamibacterales bacterium]